MKVTLPRATARVRSRSAGQLGDEIPRPRLHLRAAFYARVFGWRIRTNANGERAFDDAGGHVSSTWVLGRAPTREPGVLVWVMVDDVETTLETVRAGGGEIVLPVTPQGEGEAIATVHDPAGNVFGILHENRR